MEDSIHKEELILVLIARLGAMVLPLVAFGMELQLKMVAMV
jgi:hypothetical protein